MIEESLKTLLSELQKISRSETVIGAPIKSGDVTLLPISRVQIGFGVAGGSSGGSTEVLPPKPATRSGTGVGGGIRVEPVACIVVDKNGKAQLLQLHSSPGNTFGKVIDLVPDVLDRLGIKNCLQDEAKDGTKIETAKSK